MKNDVLKGLSELQTALYDLQLTPGTPTDERRYHLISSCNALIQLVAINALVENREALTVTIGDLEEVTRSLNEDRERIRRSSNHMRTAATVLSGLASLILVVA